MNSTFMDEGKRTSYTTLRVQAALHEVGIQLITVKEMPASTRTAKEAALAVGCTVAEIAKSLVFRTKKTDRADLVTASGANRVNEAEFAATLGEEIE